MKWLAERLMLSWGLAFLLATGAGAQIVVQGVVKPEDVPAVKPDEAPVPERQVRKPWSFRIAANELQETGSGASVTGGDLASQVDAGIGYSWVLPRASVRFIGNASQLFYRQNANLNQFLYGAGVSAAYAISRRLSWDVGDTLTSSYAQDLTAVTDAGLLPPKTLTRFNTASSVLRYDVSRTTQVRWGVAEQDVSLQSAGLSGASTFSSNGIISQQIGRAQTVSVTGDYEHTVINGTGSTILGLLGTWQRGIGQALTVTAGGGLRPYTLPGQSGFRIAPALSAGLHGRVRSKDTFGLTYDRSIEQALGNGTHLTQTVNADYALSLGTRLSLAGGGSYGRGTYPLDPSHLLTGRTGNIGMRYALMQRLALALGYSVYQRIDTPNPAVWLYRTTMSLNYGVTW